MYLRQELSGPRNHYSTVSDLAVAHPDKPLIREQYARAASIVVDSYGAAANLPAAWRLVDHLLQDLDRRDSDEPAVRERYAVAVLKLSTTQGEAGDTPAARALVDRLAVLADEHPDEPAIREQYAKAALNSSTAYGEGDDLPAARRLVDGIDALATAHPEPAIYELYARAAVGHLGAKGASADMTGASSLLDRLAASSAVDYGEVPIFSEAYATGATIMALSYVIKSDISAACSLLERIDALATEHPDHPFSVSNMHVPPPASIAYRSAGDFPAVRVLVDRLAALAAEYPNEPAIREQYTKSAVDLSIAYGNAGDDIPGGAGAARPALRLSPPITPTSRWSASNMPRPSSTSRPPTAMPATFRRRRRWWTGSLLWPPRIPISRWSASNTPRLSSGSSTNYGNAGDIPAAQALVDPLAALAAAHPDQPVVREQYAKAVLNLSTNYGNADDIPAAQALVDRLEALAAEHPDEAAIREQYAGAVVNLSVDYVKVGDIPAVSALVDRLGH